MKQTSKTLTPQQVKQALSSSDPDLVRLALDHLDYEANRSGDKAKIADAKQLRLYKTHPLYTWSPRPDRPELFDCQTSFANDRSHRVSVCLGGTGNGKSDCAARRVKFLLEEQSPPRKNTPFWILANAFDPTGRVALS